MLSLLNLIKPACAPLNVIVSVDASVVIDKAFVDDKVNISDLLSASILVCPDTEIVLK